jgi:hypothetical protein
MSITESVFIVPDNRESDYVMSNIYFKEQAFRKPNLHMHTNETDYIFTQITYINNSIIMNGLTLLINMNSSSTSLETSLLKLYAETYKISNKKAIYSINDNILKAMIESDSDTSKKWAIYIIGIWENTLEYGLEYKWLEFTHPL